MLLLHCGHYGVSETLRRQCGRELRPHIRVLFSLIDDIFASRAAIGLKWARQRKARPSESDSWSSTADEHWLKYTHHGSVVFGDEDAYLFVVQSVSLSANVH